MLSKQQFKLIKSLKRKKNRVNAQLFFAEGIKVVQEFLHSDFQLYKLYCTKDYLNPFMVNNIEIISNKELKIISEFSNPNQIFGIFEIPHSKKIQTQGFTLVLDEINDPGNLGTIIRLCDWFGVIQLVCSNNTVDCYNPKVVQASMGSLTRLSIIYTNINQFLEKEKRPVYGAFLEGKSVYKTNLEKNAVLVMGNEANGISIDVKNYIENRITIPQFGNHNDTESLNVAAASAILLSEFNR